MITWWDYWADGYQPPQGGMGMATTLPHEEPRDFAAELRKAVEQATGVVIDAPPPKRRIGFF